MNGNRGFRGITGPIMIITVGLLFALNNFTDWGFDRTWPVLIIVAGLLSLWRRTVGPPPPPPPPYVPPQPPYGSYRQTPYMQTNYPPAPEDPKKPGGAA